LGSRLVQRLVEMGTGAVRIFSRDEKKQYDMRRRFAGRENVRFFLGDIRYVERIEEAIRGSTHVINAAALKQVPLLEEAPIEAVLTNVMGAVNIYRAAVGAGTTRVVFISSDKAILPINVYGMTKAIQERVALASGFLNVETEFVVVRYGNLLGSRGSVVPVFVQAIREDSPLPVTDPEMTRFVVMLEGAVDLVLHAMRLGEPGAILVKKAPATRVIDLARGVASVLTGNPDYPLVHLGIRRGEKVHETLVSSDEMRRAVDVGSHFRIGLAEEDEVVGELAAYRSDTVERLSLHELISILERTGVTSLT
jgi:UDP-N-acetylglucosamine 4,6-dehydratase/5-epimerase